MDFLVCVKQVPDDFAQVQLDERTGNPATEGIDPVNNAFDCYALELAVRYTEAHGGSVTALMLGAKSGESGLKNLLAVGASRAYLVCDEALEGADESAIAAYLAQALPKLEQENGGPFGAILCGKESTDEISGQVGAMLAEKLDVGFVSSVIALSPCEGGFSAKQETEEGYCLYELETPAVFTIAKPDYDPRYPNIKSKMAARKAVIPIFSAAEAGISPVNNRVSCLRYSQPPKRQAGQRIAEKSALEAVEKAVALMTEQKVL